MKRQASGFTLLEVLISIVILSIGLLGMAGLVATGIKNNHTASYRSQATVLADDILDRIRANKTAALVGGQYSFTLGTTCNPSLVAANVPAFDLNEWICRIESELPGGAAAIGLGINRDVTITIQWASGLDENQDGTVNASDVLKFETVSILSQP